MIKTHLLAALGAVFMIQVHAQSVILNEMSTNQSERWLRFDTAGAPHLGTGPDWHALDFAPSAAWKTGPGPLGFGYGGEGTVLQVDVLNKAPTFYSRRAFTLTAPQAASTDPLQLVIEYDDGFVAFLNGVEIARRNMGGTYGQAYADQPTFNSKPIPTLGSSAETLAIGVASSYLREGGNILAIQVHNNAINDGRMRCSATLKTAGVTPANLVLPADSWSYVAGVVEPSGGLVDPTDITGTAALGPNWTQPDYVDTSWATGNAGFGYDSVADYVPQMGTDLKALMLNLRFSCFMRREFSLTQAEYDGITSLLMTVDFDDGMVVYLNGYELSRSNVGGVPGAFVPFNTSATGHGAVKDNGATAPGQLLTVGVLKNQLRVGRNVIAGQIHNAGTASSDLIFDLRFSAAGASPLNFADLGSPWKYIVPTSEIGIAAPVVVRPKPGFLDWVELKNTTSAPVSIAGWGLTDKRGTPLQWIFPAGTSIPANSYLVVACSGRDVRSFIPISAWMLRVKMLAYTSLTAPWCMR
jgi:Lamin Tail Domain